MFDRHGNLGSQGLPTIGVSRDIDVAEYFARGPQQTQAGHVTIFKMKTEEFNQLAQRNFENRRDVFDINPNIGKQEQEYLFNTQIDSKYVVGQYQVATSSVGDVVGLRIQQLAAEGHGVQRHGSGVTPIQLEGRSVKGRDPMTGTRVDGVHGGEHQYAQHATKVVSDEAYVYAENYARNSRQFVNATVASTTGRAQLEVPLRDIYGADFREFVYGVTRYGPKNSPTGFGNTVFSDNAHMVVRYKQDTTGNWLFNTMFPQP